MNWRIGRSLGLIAPIGSLVLQYLTAHVLYEDCRQYAYSMHTVYIHHALLCETATKVEQFPGPNAPAIHTVAR